MLDDQFGSPVARQFYWKRPGAWRWWTWTLHEGGTRKKCVRWGKKLAVSSTCCCFSVADLLQTLGMTGRGLKMVLHVWRPFSQMEVRCPFEERFRLLNLEALQPWLWIEVPGSFPTKKPSIEISSPSVHGHSSLRLFTGGESDGRLGPSHETFHAVTWMTYPSDVEKGGPWRGEHVFFFPGKTLWTIIQL